VGAGYFGELLVEESELVIAKGSGSQSESGRLLHHGLIDFRMTVSLVDRGIGGEAVEIPLSGHIPEPDALAPLEHHVERFIVVSAVSLLQSDVIPGVNREPPYCSVGTSVLSPDG
jgi:hypothetical protein